MRPNAGPNGRVRARRPRAYGFRVRVLRTRPGMTGNKPTATPSPARRASISPRAHARCSRRRAGSAPSITACRPRRCLRRLSTARSARPARRRSCGRRWRARFRSSMPTCCPRSPRPKYMRSRLSASAKIEREPETRGVRDVPPGRRGRRAGSGAAAPRHARGAGSLRGRFGGHRELRRRRQRMQARRKRSRSSSRWLAVVLVLFALNVALIGARTSGALPAADRSLFSAIGLPVNLRHLRFEYVRIARERETESISSWSRALSSRPPTSRSRCRACVCRARRRG